MICQQSTSLGVSQSIQGYEVKQERIKRRIQIIGFELLTRASPRAASHEQDIIWYTTLVLPPYDLTCLDTFLAVQLATPFFTSACSYYHSLQEHQYNLGKHLDSSANSSLSQSCC